VPKTKTDIVMKNLLTKIKENKRGLLIGSALVGITAGVFGEYGLAFIFIFPIIFFGVNAYLEARADIPKYKPMPSKRKKQDIDESNEPQNYSSYRAELFNSVRNRKKK